MSALSIQPTFPTFTDSDGTALENGFIWIGVAGSEPISTPLTAYWDAALTQVVTQPVRTRGGYPINGSAIGRLYVNSNYSIKVRNRNGFDLYSSLTATERYSEVVVNTNASQVVYDPAGSGAVATTVQAKLRESVSVKDFGAVGDGIADDGPAINLCFASAGNSEVYIPAGTYLTSVEINTNYKNFYGDGVGKTILRSIGTYPVVTVLRLVGTNKYGYGVEVDADSKVYSAVYLDNFNISRFSNSKAMNALIDGVYLPTVGGTSGTVLDGIWSIGNGSTYSTGTASVSAGGTVVTITGAANLTTLGYRVTTDFLKVGTTQRAREITAITANTVTVYPAFDTAETGVAYSLRQGSGINIDVNGNNSKIKILNCTLQNNAVAGVDERALYGASCIGNITEVNEFGRIINRRSVGGASISCEDIGCYNEVNLSGDYLIGGVNGFDLINENADAALSKIVFQPQYGSGVRIRHGSYDLSNKAIYLTNTASFSPAVNSLCVVNGAVDCTITLPAIPVNNLPSVAPSGIGGVFEFYVTVMTEVLGGKKVTIKATGADTVNGVAGATGISFSGNYNAVVCRYSTGTGWVVGGLPVSGFSGNSGGGYGAGAVYTDSVTIAGINCVGKAIALTTWGEGGSAADQYLVNGFISSRTTTGCTVNIKNNGAAGQVLYWDAVIVQ